MLVNPDPHQLKAIKNIDDKVVLYLRECLFQLDIANRNLDGIKLNRSQGAALVLDQLIKLTTENR